MVQKYNEKQCHTCIAHVHCSVKMPKTLDLLLHIKTDTCMATTLPSATTKHVNVDYQAGKMCQSVQPLGYCFYPSVC